MVPAGVGHEHHFFDTVKDDNSRARCLCTEVRKCVSMNSRLH
jgi:hypothetical protein